MVVYLHLERVIGLGQGFKDSSVFSKNFTDLCSLSGLKTNSYFKQGCTTLKYHLTPRTLESSKVNLMELGMTHR